MATAMSPVYRLNNGIEMPAGVFRSEPEKTVAAVRSAVAAGYRLIDTAAAYMNEQQVGEGVRSSGISREEIFVTTKLWISDYGYDQTLHAFDRSLRKLGFDFIDLYLLHWPVPSDFETTVNSYKAAMQLLAEDRARAIGVCNFRAYDLDRLVEQTGHVPAVNQVELHPFFNQPELRKADEKHGIITQAWSPIGGVKRYGAKASKEGVQDPLSHPTVVVRRLSCDGRSNWALLLFRNPCARNEFAENIDIFDFALSSEAISVLDTGEHGGPDPEQVNPQTFSITIQD
jgi:diketogulonate reductase-like aldo/keto reductase